MLVVSSARYLGLIVLAGGACLAQTRPTNPAPSPTPTPPTSTSPSTTTRPNTQPNQDNFPTDQPRPIFLAGKVMLDDGNPPPEAVVIERVCGSRIIQEGYTDSKGHFSIELGRNRSMFMDASLGSNDSMDSRMGTDNSSPNRSGMGGVTERSLMGCEIRANLAGFRSDSLSLATRRSLDNPDVGTLILHRMANVEGLTISATSLNAPKDAKKAFDKGREAAKKGKNEEAAKQFDKAVELYPKYAVAWYERGRVYEGQNQLDKAEAAYAEALKADPKLITPYDRLALLAVQRQKWQDAADTSARMIRLNPIDFPQAYFFNALANFNLKKLDDAEKSAGELLKMDKQHAFVKGEHLMAVIKAQKAEWQDSAAHFRTYIQYARPGEGLELAKKQLAEVEKTMAAANTPNQD